MGDADPPAASWLEDHLRRAAAFAGIYGEVSVLVVGDKRMAQLHLDHKGVPGTTDCLTFDLSGPHTPKGHVEGDLVLCLPVAKRQAKRRGHLARKNSCFTPSTGCCTSMAKATWSRPRLKKCTRGRIKSYGPSA